MILRLDQIKGLKVPLTITPGNCKNPIGCTVYVSMYDILQSYNALYPINALYTDATLSGLGTVSSPFKIAQQGAILGDALVWDGSTWTPGAVAGGGSTTITRVWIEGSTATSIDLAISGNSKTRNGVNTTFTFPTNIDAMSVYKNGQLIGNTGSLTTRDYSTSGTTITFATALLSTDSIQILKIV